MKIAKIEKIADCEQQCITVSGKDTTYITNNKVNVLNTILMGSMTELAFFTDEGWSNENIMKFFTKLRQRIDSRMKGNYYGRFVLDSSPNTLESVIDKWIWEDAPKNKQNYILTGSRWKYFPEDFPQFIVDGKQVHNFDAAFPLFKGGNGRPPKVVETEAELTTYDEVDIIWCPRLSITKNGQESYRQKALENPIEFMRDFCGIPSGAADRIFYNPDTVEACFKNNLRNMYAQITAPAEEEPEHLIWNQIRDQFFNKIMGKYYFYYEPGLPRVVCVDQSYAGDSTCIAMMHVERDPERIDPETGEALTVYVTDFTIVIIPKGGIINLDAIKFFIWDLISIGNCQIKRGGYDGFQSQPSIQFLKRKGVEIDYISVDRTNDPYMTFIDYVFHNRFFAGKNIYLKNNMKSLQMTKRKGPSGKTKIDHMNGDIVNDGDGNWATDMRGVNAKDCSDAVAGAITLLNTYSNEYVPFKTWQPEEVFDRSYDNMKKQADAMIGKFGLSIL